MGVNGNPKRVTNFKNIKIFSFVFKKVYRFVTTGGGANANNNFIFG